MRQQIENALKQPVSKVHVHVKCASVAFTSWHPSGYTISSLVHVVCSPFMATVCFSSKQTVIIKVIICIIQDKIISRLLCSVVFSFIVLFVLFFLISLLKAFTRLVVIGFTLVHLVGRAVYLKDITVLSDSSAEQ